MVKLQLTCTYLSVWADGKSILTVEGLLGKNGELHPVQTAFIEEAAVQCGLYSRADHDRGGDSR